MVSAISSGRARRKNTSSLTPALSAISAVQIVSAPLRGISASTSPSGFIGRAALRALRCDQITANTPTVTAPPTIPPRNAGPICASGTIDRIAPPSAWNSGGWRREGAEAAKQGQAGDRQGKKQR